MKPRDLIAALKKAFDVRTDSALSKMIGRTGGSLSQWQKSNRSLTPRQLASVIRSTSDAAERRALKSAIRPIVEQYPIDKVPSPQARRWELLATDQLGHPRNHAIRSYLEKAKGIYFFYGSTGKVLYTGKTEKQNLWNEMRLAFNRERQTHKVY